MNIPPLFSGGKARIKVTEWLASKLPIRIALNL